MTTVICAKVNDGVVLAADSASTLSFTRTDGTSDVRNVYNNATKIFNLCKGVPIGLLMWNRLYIGGVSVSNLVKEFRAHLCTKGDALEIDPQDYKVETIAKQFSDFVHAAYDNPYDNIPIPEGFYVGFIIAGYSSGGERSEEYLLVLYDQKDAGGALTLVTEGPTLIGYEGKQGKDVGAGVFVKGQTEAAHRLFKGYGEMLAPTFDGIEAMPDGIQKTGLINLKADLFVPLAHPEMPIPDAIDLAEFLLSTTINYTRFKEGSQTVGGPVELAAITKYEGFKWVRRKHYFTSEFNPAQSV